MSSSGRHWRSPRVAWVCAVIAVAVTMWIASAQWTVPSVKFGDDPGSGGSVHSAAPSIASVTHDRSSVAPSRVRLVDLGTGLPLSGVGLVYDVGTGVETAHTSSDGIFLIVPGRLNLRPSAEGAFDPVVADVKSGDQDISVAGRFHVQLSGGEGAVACLRELAAGDGVAQAAGGLVLGKEITRWRVPGSYWWPTTPRPLVIEIDRGVIRPSHPVWSGEVVPGGDGTQQVSPPTRFSPARVSKVFNVFAGAHYEFVVEPDPESVRFEYLLSSPATGPGLVELMVVKPFGDGHRVVGVAHSRAVDAGASSVVFDAVEIGEYVLRSCVRREERIDLAWQVCGVGPTARGSCLEREGEGDEVIWFGLDTKSLMVVHVDLDDAVRHGIAIGYPAFDIAGASCLRGVHGKSGSVRIFDRRTQTAERYLFDLRVRSTIEGRR